MIVLEVTEDKVGKVMKATSKILEHAECLKELFEDMVEESEYGDRYGNRRKYDDDDMYGSRYGSRRSMGR